MEWGRWKRRADAAQEDSSTWRISTARRRPARTTVGVGMAEDDEALALVGARLELARTGSWDSTTRSPSSRWPPRSRPRAPLGRRPGRAGRRRRSRTCAAGGMNSSRIETSAQTRRSRGRGRRRSSEVNWAPGGRAATSEIAMEPSARRNHSMWVIPVTMPRASSAAGRPRGSARTRGRRRPAGSRTVHWIQGDSMTCSGVGEYSEIEWKRCRPPIDTLSKEYSRPWTNSSSSRACAGVGGCEAIQLSSCETSSTRKVSRAPAPAGGLATSGHACGARSSGRSPRPSPGGGRRRAGHGRAARPS